MDGNKELEAKDKERVLMQVTSSNTGNSISTYEGKDGGYTMIFVLDRLKRKELVVVNDMNEIISGVKYSIIGESTYIQE